MGETQATSTDTESEAGLPTVFWVGAARRPGVGRSAAGLCAGVSPGVRNIKVGGGNSPVP